MEERRRRKKGEIGIKRGGRKEETGKHRRKVSKGKKRENLKKGKKQEM